MRLNPNHIMYLSDIKGFNPIKFKQENLIIYDDKSNILSEKTERLISSCGTMLNVSVCPNHSLMGGDCDTPPLKTVCYCFNRYCKNPDCIDIRIRKALLRLNSMRIFPDYIIQDWLKIRKSLKNNHYSDCLIKKVRDRFFYDRKSYSRELPERVIHFSIGSIYYDKSTLNKLCNEIIRKVRRKFKVKFHYISVFDLSRKNYPINNAYFLHNHYAVIPEKSLYTVKERDKINKFILKESGKVGLCFKNYDFKPRAAVFSYFSKRAAGMLGHKKEGYYYYADLMGLPTFFKEYYGKLFITYGLPVGLASTTMPRKTIECPKCHTNFVYLMKNYPIDPKFNETMQCKASLSDPGIEEIKI